MTGDLWRDAMRKIEAGEDVQQACEEVSRKQTEGVREMLRAEGRADLVAEMDANLRDVRLGLTHARAVWHSISPAQRRVLQQMGEGRHLVPARASKTRYDMRGVNEVGAMRDVCSTATVRALHSRSLIEPRADNVFTYTLTEHARFVLKHGPQERAGDA